TYRHRRRRPPLSRCDPRPGYGPRHPRRCHRHRPTQARFSSLAPARHCSASLSRSTAIYAAERDSQIRSTSERGVREASVRPQGVVPPAGAHGGDVAAVAAALGVEPSGILDLSASFNPDAPDLTALAKTELDSLSR